MDSFQIDTHRNPILIAEPQGQLVCLNFKVPLRLRQQFKICAAQHNMTMTDLLLHLVENCLANSSNPKNPHSLIEKEIKK
jgi:hypothetical protein